MIRGRIIAESFRVGIDIQVPELKLLRLGRHDVSGSTLPADERNNADGEHGVVPGQPTTWTFVDFEGPDWVAADLMESLANALDAKFGWWADFTISDAEHVIVFAGRSFRYCIGDETGRAEAVAYGRSLGTPEYQLDWGP
jgi:hypothetical protein